MTVQITRLVEDFRGARLPDPEEEHALRLPSGVPVTRNIRTAYVGDQPVEVLDTISHGEVVSHRFDIGLGPSASVDTASASPASE